MSDTDTGLVFNVQRFSVHDGSGIRTVVFLKGCPLRCAWCANPEGISPRAELAFDRDKCLGVDQCGRCVPRCSRDALEVVDDEVRLDRARCDACGDCLPVCPPKSLEVFGKSMTVDEVLGAVEADSTFYSRSGGGLTLSGGEPLLQADFCLKLLCKAQSRGIDTAVETSGLVKWSVLEQVAEHADEVFFDIKLVDGALHEEATGVSNQLILRNFQRLVERFPRKPIVVRTPVIPGVNDADADIAAIADIVASAPGNVRHELLPYHRFALGKYRALDTEYGLEELEPPGDEQMQRLRRIALRLA